MDEGLRHLGRKARAAHKHLLRLLRAVTQGIVIVHVHHFPPQVALQYTRAGIVVGIHGLHLVVKSYISRYRHRTRVLKPTLPAQGITPGER